MVKDKKKRKKKDRKRKKHKLALAQKESSSSKQQDVIKVPLEKSIASSDSACGACSWSSVFGAASQLPLAEGADDVAFFSKTESSSSADPGLAKISELAAECRTTHANGDAITADLDTQNNKTHGETDAVTPTRKRKRSASSDNDSTNDEPATLEGRMVPHPHNPSSEQVMVLVDSQRNAVYSALKRSPSGDYVSIGTLHNGNVCFDKDAFSDDEKANASSDPFPFPTDPDDHCESPLEAYRDILPLLNLLCRGNKKDDVTIYDPYYCDGAVKRNLAQLGFPRVVNERQDCYRVWSTGIDYPAFDVLVTNPPYSGTHIEQLLEHVTNANFGTKPWFLLLPQWVHKKDYYKSLVTKIRPFFLVPRKRYVYRPPKEFRSPKKSDVHKKSSPFVSMWYVWGGSLEMNEELIQHYLQQPNTQCDLVRSKSALRDLRRKGKRNKNIWQCC